MPSVEYRLTLETPTGGRLREIPFLTATSTERINQAESLRFTVAREDMRDVAIEFPRRVRVRQNGTTLYIARIMQTSFTVDGDGKEIISVDAEGLLGDLGRVDASTLEENKAANSITSDLIALQTGTAYPALTLGTVDFTDTVSVRGGGSESALGILNRMRDALGGQYWVSSTGELNWRAERYTQAGKRMRLEKNLSDIVVTVNYRTIRTTVQLEGAGGITASATDESEYGPTIPYRQSFPNISNVNTLQLVANQLLSLFKRPQNTIRVTAIDLASFDVNFAYEQIRLGERVRLYANNLTPDDGVMVRVTGVERGMANEDVSVRVDLDTDENFPRVQSDFLDTIAELVRVSEVEQLELATAPPPNAGSESDEGTSGLAARSDHTHGPPTGGALDDWKDALDSIEVTDASPEDVSTAAAVGASDEAARADHVHKWDIDTFTTTDYPENVAPVGSADAGNSNLVARRDHVHAWDITDFPTVSRVYFAENTGALSGTFRDGDVAFTSDDNQYWGRSNGVWEPILRFEVPST